MPEIGTGIQPQDNPSPIPSGGESDVSDLLTQLQGEAPKPSVAAASPQAAPPTPPQVEQKNYQSENKSLVDQLLGAPESDSQKELFSKQRPDEKMGAYAARAYGEQFKMLGAQLRANLADDPTMQRQAFESMYGPNNVRTKEGKLEIRPQDDEKWRPINAKMIGPINDYVAYHALRLISDLPGMGIQVAGTAIGTGLGVLAGGPAAPATAAAGAVAGSTLGGAVGGGIGPLIRNAMMGGINQVSDAPQNNPNFDLKKRIMTEAGFGAVAGLVGGAVGARSIVKQGADQFAKVVADASPEAAEKMLSAEGSDAAGSLVNSEGQTASKQIQKLAMVRTAFKTFRNTLMPSLADTENAGDVGEKVGDAIDKIHDDLGKSVGVVRKEALALARSRNDYVPADNTMAEIQKRIKGSHYFDDNGMAVKMPEDRFRMPDQTVTRQVPGLMGAPVTQTETIPGKSYAIDKGGLEARHLETTRDQLANFYNELQSGKLAGQGKDLPSFWQDLDKLSENAKYSKDTPTESTTMFRGVRNAAASDRNAYLSDLFDKSQSPYKDTWKNALDNYHSKIDAVNDLQAMTENPAQRRVLVNSLNSARTGEKLELLGNFKTILGEDSPQWNALRGEVFDHLVGEHTQAEGVINALALREKLFVKPANREFVNTLFSKDEQTVLNKMLVQASRVSTTGAMGESQKQIIEDGLPTLIKMGSPETIVRRAFQIFGNNKRAVDFLTDDGFLNAAQKVQGEEAKQRILKAMQIASDMRSHMQIVNVNTGGERASAKAIQRYAPYVSGAAEGEFDRRLNPSNPQQGKANFNPTPQPMQ